MSALLRGDVTYDNATESEVLVGNAAARKHGHFWKT